MLDSVARVAKEMILTPFATALEAIHPNTITIISLVPGLLSAWFASQGMVSWSVTMWAANRILDGLDGTMARIQGSQSDFGGYLDILIDFVVYAVVPIGIALGRPTQLNWLALSFLLAVYYLNSASWMYLSSILEKRGNGTSRNREMTTITMPTGIIEGTETIIAYFLFLLFPNFSVILFSLFGMLVLLTIGQRLVWAKRHL